MTTARLRPALSSLLALWLLACSGSEAPSSGAGPQQSKVLSPGQGTGVNPQSVAYTPDCSYPAGTFTAESRWRVAYKPGSAWTNLAPWAFWAVSAARPAVLVELGSHNGYSTFAFTQAIHDLELPTRAYAVDTWKGDEQSGLYDDSTYQTVAARTRTHYPKNLSLLRMTFDQALAHFDEGSVDLLHIDGLHHYHKVKHDFDTWLPKMSARGVILFHDIDVHQPDFGVDQLWAELTALYPSFAFHQGPGLGILGVGKDLPEAFVNLFAAHATEEGECVQRIYQALGHEAEAWQPPQDW